MSQASDHAPPPRLGPEGYKALNMSPQQRAFYQALARETAQRIKQEEFVIRIGEGRGFKLAKGHIIRVACDQGPQVADLIVFNLHDPKEQFSAGGTRMVHGTHVTTGDRLWSRTPYAQPLLTVIADTVDRQAGPNRGTSHDLLYSPCDEHHYERLTGKKGHPNCRSNLAEAIAPFGLTWSDVHDPLNIFMTTGVNANGRLFYNEPVAKAGDYLELYAETDCILAFSACPGASSGSTPGNLKITLCTSSLLPPV